MRRILIAIAGYAFMAWWKNRISAHEVDETKRRRQTRSPQNPRGSQVQGTAGQR